MKAFLLTAFVLASGMLSGAQEREVPKDSMRIFVPGCANGRMFVVGPRAEHEPGRSTEIAPGRRFRLAGPKKLLQEIDAREGVRIEITGLIRKVADPAGVSLGGGVRLGPGPTYNSPGRDSGFNESVMDVESWRLAPGDCPAR